MTRDPVRILIVGAGVIGSVYGAWLVQAGHHVSILARGRRLEELREHGLQIEDAATGQADTVAVATSDHLAPDDAYDLAIVAVRLEQVDDILPTLAANRAIPTMLFLLNNAFGVQQYTQAIGCDRVVVGFPGIGGAREGSTIRYYVLPQQPTTLSEVGEQITPRLRALGALFTATGHPVEMTRHIDAWLKTHAVFVTCVAAAITQVGGDNARLAQDRQLVATMVQAIREGFRALARQGIHVTPHNLAILFNWTPRRFAVWYWQRALMGPVGALAIAPHARRARGEMAALAIQTLTMLAPSAWLTPTLRQLLATLTAADVFSRQSVAGIER